MSDILMVEKNGLLSSKDLDNPENDLKDAKTEIENNAQELLDNGWTGDAKNTCQRLNGLILKYINELEPLLAEIKSSIDEALIDVSEVENDKRVGRI